MEKRKFIVALHMLLPVIWKNLRSSCKVHDIWGSVKRIGFSRQIFVKLLNIEFHCNLSSARSSDIYGQTGGRTDGHGEASRLRDAAKVPKTVKCLCKPCLEGTEEE